MDGRMGLAGGGEVGRLRSFVGLLRAGPSVLRFLFGLRFVKTRAICHETAGHPSPTRDRTVHVVMDLNAISQNTGGFY